MGGVTAVGENYSVGRYEVETNAAYGQTCQQDARVWVVV